MFLELFTICMLKLDMVGQTNSRPNRFRLVLSFYRDDMLGDDGPPLLTWLVTCILG